MTFVGQLEMGTRDRLANEEDGVRSETVMDAVVGRGAVGASWR